VVVGLARRVASGSGGAPVSFAVVAALVVGTFLLGWRCAVAVAAFGVTGLQRLAEEGARRHGPP
jgi:hypothetical protein